jgi:predicted helicase
MNCEVRHTAASHDGGIDLYAITAERNVYAVQCKRREGPITESVEQVRAFLGAMISAEVPRGIFVSTADHFSPQAVSLANAPPLKNMGIELELIDYEVFRQLFNLTVPQVETPWRKLVSSDYSV